MVDELHAAVADAEAELARLRARHADQLEAERVARRQDHAALVTEVAELTAREAALQAKLEAENRTLAARGSVRWETHVAAFALALCASAIMVALILWWLR